MGKPLVDMTNERFGRLTVISYTGKNINGNAVWLCKCDCGNTKEVSRSCLVHGNTKSCGCLKKEVTGELSRTHGLSKHKHLRWVYESMKQRCYNSNNKSYKHYGGRGVTVCDEWRDNFEAFYNWAIEKGYDEKQQGNKQTLDRINNNGNYEPNNCRLVNRFIQANNTRRNVYYTYDGKTLTLAQWAKELNIKYITLHERVRKGWSIEKALETPVRKR